MIFPVVDCERELQIGDKTRLLGVKSFVSRDDGPISKVEICPELTGGVVVTPIEITTSGFVPQDRPDQVTNLSLQDSEMAQIKVGFTIESPDGYDVQNIIAVDYPNYTVTVPNSAPFGNLTFGFVIKGSSSSGVEPVYFDVSGRGESDWYLDWVYRGLSRDVNVAVRVTSNQVVETATKILKVLTKDNDQLFSSDDDLIALEPSLTRYPAGRSSFLNVHREAKAKILEALSDKGIRNADGSDLTASILMDKNEVRTWSRDLTLQLIFQGGSNSADDVFFAKAKYYQGQVEQRASKAYLTLSVPIEDNQPYRSGQIQSVGLMR